MCVCLDGAWSEEQAQATVVQSSFWTRALQIMPALCPECHSALCAHSSASCEDDHRDPAQSTSHRARGRASTARPPSAAPFIAKTCGHYLSDTAVANSTLACTQLCFCTHKHLFSGADVGLSLHAASWEPCTPEANSKSSIRSSQHASPLCWCFQPNSWKSNL